ncbi:MAG TPA: hypothetical protein VFX98_19955 [Longimicrobiaceae bacterium]|nr:hypothetical protein [Longimicrobiaceae bacterium]
MSTAAPCADERAAARAGVLRALGATRAQAEELLRYNENAFAVPDPAPGFPLADEPFVAAWEEYAADAAERGAVAALRARLPQLAFPVAAGVGETAAYRAATRRGEAPPPGPGLALEAPERVRLFLHPTAAGRIPVVHLEHRADFVALVRALVNRNEPVPVPPSQGASMVAGYNNWDRVGRLRAAFARGPVPGLEGAVDWGEAFARMRGRPELYQDCFILLSGGPYSGVAAGSLGLAEDEWRALSFTIRLEHECAHYFTRRVLGAMRNTLLDELIADYAGIAAAAGRYRADWFLRFLGLEEADGYRAGGRMENYRGKPPLSDGAFRVLQALVRRAARALEQADAALPASGRGMEERARMITALAACTLEELADDGAAERLQGGFFGFA